MLLGLHQSLVKILYLNGFSVSFLQVIVGNMYKSDKLIIEN